MRLIQEKQNKTEYQFIDKWKLKTQSNRNTRINISMKDYFYLVHSESENIN